MSAEAAAARRGAAREDVDHYTALYRRMMLIRRFEDAVQSLFHAGEVHGTTHLYSGQEAVSVGVASVLSDGDQVAGTYRGHGCALALGVSPQGLMDELLGRATGVCAGRAGSMNIVDRKHGLIGCFSIVGGSIAAATGAAAALRGTSNVAVAFFGDGAVNQAYFPECLNFAKVLSLPVVYVCENNRYGEFTPFEQVTAGQIRARPAAMEIPSSSIDGNDVWAVRQAAREAVERARSGDGPSFIEALTYRFVGHSRTDPGKYRPPGELDSWRERDPLAVTRSRLIEGYGAQAGALDTLADEVEQEVLEVRERALAAPFPSPSTKASEFKGGNAEMAVEPH
jgi:acetoin:2,6-dichlorophenolindophenol oxidoreductase subunit alpha